MKGTEPMSLHHWIILFLFMMPSVGCQDSQQKEVNMQGSKHDLEQIRTRHEADLMTIPGVVGVGTGICKSGNECLKIYTSVPTDQVRTRLPEELKKIEIELEFVGEIKAE
jgi:hypothetical protein